MYGVGQRRQDYSLVPFEGSNVGNGRNRLGANHSVR